MRSKLASPLTAVLLLVALAPAGTVFKTVYQFPGGESGGVPVNIGSLAVDGRGNLYGTTQQGGKYGRGTVFRLSRKDNEIKKTVLWNFQGPDGARPLSAVVLDESVANIYGTTLGGGKCSKGTVFRLTNSDSQWNETVLHSFCGTRDGENPYAGLILDPNAPRWDDDVVPPGKKGCCYIYGTTRSDGRTIGIPAGIVFGISRSGSYEVVYRFCSRKNCRDGKYPKSGVIVDQDRNLYGMTFAGGRRGSGTVFRISRSGSKWTETVLYDFDTHKFTKIKRDGANPQSASLTLGTDGTIFGVTTAGGDSNNGTVFQLKLTGSKYTESVLHCFGGGPTDGAKPEGTLIIDSAGHLYGTTTVGGVGRCGALKKTERSAGCGTVFELIPPKEKGGNWTEKVLHSFTGLGDGLGGYPESGLVLNPANSAIYGVTTQTNQLCDSTQQPDLYRCGVLFELKP
jgi:uncharacterized repeat protein (TIGR03803 family)